MSTRSLLLLAVVLMLGACESRTRTVVEQPEMPELPRGPDPFVFRTDPPEAYVQLDRMGVPAIATVLIPPSERDRFNTTEPHDDGQYSDLIAPMLGRLVCQLRPALLAAGLAPCPIEGCIMQAVPEIIPDVLRLDLRRPDGFPNARTLDDPVVDRVVSVALLDLVTPGDCSAAVPPEGVEDGRCTVNTLERIPMNPPENEIPLESTFPYFGLPHPPP